MYTTQSLYEVLSDRDTDRGAVNVHLSSFFMLWHQLAFIPLFTSTIHSPK